MRNTELEETQTGIKIARRNISNLGYVDDTTLIAENEEELKSLLMKVKEESGRLPSIGSQELDTDWNENSPFPVLWPLLSYPYLLEY